jgi:hypothetical protein
MTDVVLMKSAQMQRRIKDLEHDNKIKRNMLLERDEEIKKIQEEHQKEIEKLKDDIAFKNRMLKELRPKPKIRKVKKDEN